MLIKSVKKTIIGLLSMLFVFTKASSLLAQTACFNVDIEQGCSPLTVEITDCSGATDITYIITSNDFPDVNISYSGNQLTNGNVQHTFDDPSDWTIRQIVGTGGGANETSLNVTVEPPTTPELSLLACSGNGVRVSIANDFVYDFYDIDFGDGTVQRFEKPFPIIEYAYGNNQPVTVLVQGGFKQGDGSFIKGNCGQATAEFTPVAAIEAAQINRLEAQVDGSLTFDYVLPQQLNYTLEESINGGGYTEIEQLDNTTTQLDLNDKAQPANSYCYRIAATDVCTGDIFYSDIICTTYLTAIAQNNQNVLTWPEYPNNIGFVDYSIARRNDDNAELIPPIANRTTTTYLDTDVICQAEYCYQLEVELDNGSVSVSPNTCVIAISDDPPPEAGEVVASVQGDNVVLSWIQPQGIQSSGVTVVKVLPDGTLNEATGITQPLIDTAVDVSSSTYCYEVVFEDACGNTSSSATTCTMLLSGEQDETGNSLSWTPFVAEDESFDYFVEIVDEDGTVIRTVAVTNLIQLTFTDLLDDLESLIMRYRIVAISNSGLQSRSNTVTIIRDTSVKVPDAFTPNNDGLNDTFRAYAEFLDAYTLEVFNRWGNMLYQSEDIEMGWDGSYQGKEVPAGPYTYVISAIDEAGNEIKQKGVFLLVR